MQAQNNNNQSLNIAIDCSSCYHFGFLNSNIMNSERIKQLQEQTAYPESRSVNQALLQVWNECQQEKMYIPF